MIHGMNHFIITAEDRVKTRDYYCGLLGPTGRASPRPGLPGCVGLRRRRGRLMPTRSVVASACPPTLAPVEDELAESREVAWRGPDATATDLPASAAE